MKDIIFNLKTEYFEEIKNGLKTEEYREYKEYWVKRLVNKDYKNIIIKKGYPKKGDLSNTLTFPWKGYIIKDIKHDIFGGKKIKVFAILLK